MGSIKDAINNKFYGDLKYDRQETFTFKDGGKIKIDFKGRSFVANTNEGSDAPVLFVVPGLTSTS